jgi:FtsP/CotA-like multicopper oxidase with cupredoxin domain
MEVLHAGVLAAGAAGGAAHSIRDGALLLPLALVATFWGLQSPRRGTSDLARVGARIALAYGCLLAPAAAAHDALHGADGAAVAHAATAGSASPSEMLSHGPGLAAQFLHGAIDAALALPCAFALSLIGLVLLSRRHPQAFIPSATRRLRVVGASMLVVAGAAVIVPVSGAVSPDYATFSMPLVIPPVLTGANIDIDIAETQEQILPGSPTTMWTYNGSFPGPIIRRPTGVPTNVTFTNHLPESVGSLSVHHHGTQAPEQDDGHPSRFLIAPGASKTYTYPGIDAGAPERAAPQWYHDHRDMVTGRNVWMGMLGAFIYDDALEQSLDLPPGAYDVPLMVTDREFDADNQIPYTFVSSGTFGDVILVNGVAQPFFEVGDRRYRFRLYNASNRRDYSFALSNGQAMTQIGTDSGLLPAPVSRASIRLGPAERADVVIDFAGHLGENIVLQNGDAALGPGDRDGEVMQFRVTQDLTDDSSEVPAALRPVFATDTPVTTRVWTLDRTGGTWTINGKGFDASRVDAQPVLGTTERWIFRNTTTLPHIAHVHLGDQKLVSRNGQPPAPYERVKESWYLAPGDEVVVDITFSDYVGTFIFHCHVLEHEDDAMMTQFQTVRPPEPGGAAAPGTIPAPDDPGAGAQPPAPTGAGPAHAGLPPLSRTIRILSSKRLRPILLRGIRFESAVPATRASLRAELRVRGRLVAVERRTRLARGRVRVTLTLSRAENARLRRLIAGRRTVAAQLRVIAGGETRTARFTIWR